MKSPRENAESAERAGFRLGPLRFSSWRKAGVLLSWLLLATASALSAASLSVGNGREQPGGAVTVPVTLQSVGNVVALQADVRFNANVFTLEGVTASAAGTNHTVSSSQPATGVGRVLLYSLTNHTLGNGALVNMRFLIRSNAPEGVYLLTLSNAILAEASAASVSPGALSGGALTVQRETNCTYALSAAHAAFKTAGGTGSVAVIAPATCPWLVVNTNSWITLATNNGFGNKTVTYIVAKNTRLRTRTGTLLIAGQKYLIIQSDTTRPTVAIVLPTLRTRVFTNANVPVQGTAKDNVGVARVQYSLNSKTNFLPALGTTNWTAGITLVTGLNTLRVRSIDLAGNVSAVVTRTWRYRPPVAQAAIKTIAQAPDEQWHFGFTTVAGSTYVLQSSTDLQQWTGLNTNLATTTSLSFTNRIDRAIPQQFFRLKKQR